MRHKPLLSLEDFKELVGQLVLFQTGRMWQRVGIVTSVSETGTVWLDMAEDGQAPYSMMLYSTMVYATTDTTMPITDRPDHLTRAAYIQGQR